MTTTICTQEYILTPMGNVRTTSAMSPVCLHTLTSAKAFILATCLTSWCWRILRQSMLMTMKSDDEDNLVVDVSDDDDSTSAPIRSDQNDTITVAPAFGSGCSFTLHNICWWHNQHRRCDSCHSFSCCPCGTCSCPCPWHCLCPCCLFRGQTCCPVGPSPMCLARPGKQRSRCATVNNCSDA